MLFVQGIAAMLPFMKRQVTDISRSDLVIFLKEGNPLYTSLSPPTAAKFGELGKYACIMIQMWPSDLMPSCDTMV